MIQATDDRTVSHPATADAAPADLIPAEFSPRIARGFAAIAERYMLRRDFHAVRLLGGSREALAGVAGHDGPLVMLQTHPAWWDPLVGYWLHKRFFGLQPVGTPETGPRSGNGRGGGAKPWRSGRAAMSSNELRRFGLFRKLGVFGIDPASPASLSAMAGYLDDYFKTAYRPTAWLTPQGRFTDARERAPLRPGAARLAAMRAETRVVVVAVEYAFLLERKPEVLISAAEIGAPRRTTAGWHRAIAAGFEHNRDRLAEAVIARDPVAFSTEMGGDEGGGSFFVYEWWQKARGTKRSVRDESRTGGVPSRPPGGGEDGGVPSKPAGGTNETAGPALGAGSAGASNPTGGQAGEQERASWAS